jgi:hypothetical protein
MCALLPFVELSNRCIGRLAARDETKRIERSAEERCFSARRFAEAVCRANRRFALRVALVYSKSVRNEAIKVLKQLFVYNFTSSATYRKATRTKTNLT